MKLKYFISIILSIVVTLFFYDYFIYSPYKGERTINSIKYIFHTTSLKSDKNQQTIFPLRKSILDENNTTITKTIRMQKLFLANNIMDKKEFTCLIDELSKIIPINRYVIHYYCDEHKNIKEYPFKTVAYGISTANLSKVKALLENTFHLKKGDYLFVISGEKIVYPQKDMLTPYIGYTRKRIRGNYTYRQGMNGLQGYYDKRLSAVSDEKYKKELILYIMTDLQKKLEKELDMLKIKKDFQEVIAVIIDPDNYHIKAIASSNRYDANKIYKKDKQNLEIHAILYLFKIGNFINPIKDYKAFGLYEKSGIDLSYERTYNNKALNNDIKCFKINFIQLVKMYAVFYNGGKIGKPTIVKTHIPLTLKQIISKKDADTVKVMLPHFFDKIKNKKFIIEKQDSNETAHIYMKEINFNGKNYLKAYFMIDKKKDD